LHQGGFSNVTAHKKIFKPMVPYTSKLNEIGNTTSLPKTLPQNLTLAIFVAQEIITTMPSIGSSNLAENIFSDNITIIKYPHHRIPND
jgi:hypothetical protein